MSSQRKRLQQLVRTEASVGTLLCAVFSLAAWIGYQPEQSSTVDWRVQLNVCNIGENVHLLATAVEPDGSVAQQCIVNGATYSMKPSF